MKFDVKEVTKNQYYLRNKKLGYLRYPKPQRMFCTSDKEEAMRVAVDVLTETQDSYELYETTSQFDNYAGIPLMLTAEELARLTELVDCIPRALDDTECSIRKKLQAADYIPIQICFVTQYQLSEGYEEGQVTQEFNHWASFPCETVAEGYKTLLEFANDCGEADNEPVEEDSIRAVMNDDVVRMYVTDQDGVHWCFVLETTPGGLDSKLK